MSIAVPIVLLVLFLSTQANNIWPNNASEEQANSEQEDKSEETDQRSPEKDKPGKADKRSSGVASKDKQYPQIKRRE